ncbi:glutathione-disulfide reductase [Niveispirillum irakense]|uniref:glutathione-disulfide reductase n=1 Tax=Niveispirillum irakense TaxID=34011 RepID=UPI00041CFD4B|nr:glutathione-disulfide reductase [Niveispirillum irakense]
MPTYDYDLFTIGAGSGGVRASRIASQHGARVAVAEERYYGGTCVNVGCVPKKLLVYAGEYGHAFEDAAGFGWNVEKPTHDWKALIEAKDKEIGRLNGIYRRLLEGAGVTLFDGRATIVDAHTVEVNGQKITAERILVATGGWPELPDQPGAREYGITSNEVFYLPTFPKRVLVAGGGYIALEFASLLKGLGADVTLLYRGHQILRGFDSDVRTFVTEELVKSGINLRLNTIIERIEKSDDCLLATLTDNQAVECDAVIYAIGRKPLTANLGLEQVGVELDKNGAIKVNDQYQTSVPSIYALGDVTNRINLTPVALAEGHVLADRLYGNNQRDVNYDNIPTAVFSIPPVANVGLTEEQAREKLGKEVDIYRTSFKPMRHQLSGRDQRTMMKLVVDRATQKVIGVHMVGSDTPEMVQAIAIAMNVGATKQDFDRTIGLHPTAAEEFVTMRVKAPDPD